MAVAAAVVYFTQCAATDQAHQAPNRLLRNYDGADTEERAPGVVGKWHWGPFSSATWEIMLTNEEYQRKIFVKWNKYKMDKIREEIGEDVIRGNSKLAEMIVKHVRTRNYD
ncbi:hypothetical protein GN244_ATG12047 [Phytophthora infestans]|uniref:Uncharacterized protein n=1 Tax=Phytophthora infestans TaxID=4787 RepID=A0A833WSW9_PHYIN|nr:hypothetical protein GN244_ATG12047 [Phytophthora infestans]